MTIIRITLRDEQYTFLITYVSFLLRKINISNIFREKFQRHTTDPTTLFSENFIAYEIMYNNNEYPDKATDDIMAHKL